MALLDRQTVSQRDTIDRQTAYCFNRQTDEPIFINQKSVLYITKVMKNKNTDLRVQFKYLLIKLKFLIFFALIH